MMAKFDDCTAATETSRNSKSAALLLLQLVKLAAPFAITGDFVGLW
jgi:hypothetical protein